MSDLVKKICVMDVASVRAICFPVFDTDYEDQLFDRREVGSIISIEQSPAEPGEPLEGWRLSPTEAGIIPRHFSSFFYTHEAGQDGLKDLFIDLRDKALIKEKATSLADDLAAANKFLAALKSEEKMIVHCNHGRHRSPALATAILISQYPKISNEEILDMLVKVCVKRPQLRKGEIAFIDAFFGRDGELVKAWATKAGQFYESHIQFDSEKATRAQERFASVLGPDTAGSLKRTFDLRRCI